MSKIVDWLIGFVICVAIILWLVKDLIGVDIIKNIKEDERPINEQVGSGLKNINQDFQIGLNDTTIINIDSIKK